MKTVVLISSLILSSFNIAQAQVYQNALNLKLNSYNYNRPGIKVIDENLLNRQMNNAFSTVIFSNSDFAKNTSAFGFSLNEEKTEFTGNTNFKLFDNHKNYVFLNFGINASGSSTIFSFYDKNRWQDKVGGSIGVIWKFFGSTYYSQKDYSRQNFQNHQAMRRTYMSDPIIHPNKYNQNRIQQIDLMLNEILQLNNGLINNATVPELVTLLGSKSTYEIHKLLVDEKEKIIEYQSAITGGALKLESYLSERLSKFDSIVNPTYGYHFWWFHANLNASNSTYQFEEDNIDTSARSSYNQLFEADKKFNHLKLTLNFGINVTFSKKNHACFLSLSKTFYEGSMMDVNLLDGTPKVYTDQLIIQDENKRQFGGLQNLETDNIQYGSIDFYGALFFAKKKTLGINVNFKHYYTIGEYPSYNSLENNFTLLFGPIFRKIKDDKTSSTFGIDLGWENAFYGKNITDDFTVCARVGIPFNIFEKQ